MQKTRPLVFKLDLTSPRTTTVKTSFLKYGEYARFNRVMMRTLPACINKECRMILHF